MKFQTEILIPNAAETISYQDELLLMGSCFVENMGKKFQELNFQVTVNPFGVLYNPASIAGALERLMNPVPFEAADLFHYEEIWHSFAHHSRFSLVSEKETLHAMNDELALGAKRLKKARWLIITFGTAWIYRLADTGMIVANCHKLPEKQFLRSRMSGADIVEQFIPLIRRLKGMNPDLQILMTVSPIRHWKDGAHENQLSKAILLLAIEQLQQQFAFVHYFPAYELMLDELRDYRFYAEDMMHPNAIAIDFIWEKLLLHYIHPDTQRTIREVEQINKALQHRALHPDSEAYSKFRQQLDQKIKTLQKAYPFLRFDK
ncbi:GSCFA domain-containing protein [Microbacter margulisiae]|uniref:GSCFA domain-containing protein n=1 Tax=Microbacter margulisiae TaxID=1350067 RepID=A0A7W5DNU5_9PORP|nr:GSCFA domain-containing protein [Microbacter margulisiae]MBB3186344.1 hypothetical protein [Microbacter margulisiae]